MTASKEKDVGREDGNAADQATPKERVKTWKSSKGVNEMSGLSRKRVSNVIDGRVLLVSWYLQRRVSLIVEHAGSWERAT